MNIDQVRADHRRLRRPRETTVREWLEDVMRRPDNRTQVEQAMLEVVLRHLVGIADQAWETVEHDQMLHDRLMFLRSPVRLIDD